MGRHGAHGRGIAETSALIGHELLGVVGQQHRIRRERGDERVAQVNEQRVGKVARRASCGTRFGDGDEGTTGVALAQRLDDLVDRGVVGRAPAGGNDEIEG